MVELLACPFCGSADIAEGRETTGRILIVCQGCGTQGMWARTDYARKQWNRRAGLEAVRREELEPVLQELRDAVANKRMAVLTPTWTRTAIRALTQEGAAEVEEQVRRPSSAEPHTP